MRGPKLSAFYAWTTLREQQAVFRREDAKERNKRLQ